jgi:hypothetical protein
LSSTISLSNQFRPNQCLISISCSAEFIVNPYCQSLKGLFGELAYFGILKESDAQCLKTDIQIEPSFYFLLGAALLLSLINTFVVKANQQYLTDSECAITVPSKVDTLDDLGIDGSNSDDAKKTILPIPIMFTDRFRWVLHREDSVFAVRRLSSTEFQQVTPNLPQGPTGRNSRHSYDDSNCVRSQDSIEYEPDISVDTFAHFDRDSGLNCDDQDVSSKDDVYVSKSHESFSGLSSPENPFLTQSSMLGKMSQDVDNDDPEFM